MHTGREIDQIYDDTVLGTENTPHTKYENFVTDNWNTGSSFGNLVEKNSEYYTISSPSQATKNLATFSHSYLDTLYYRIKNNPSGYTSDTTVKRITQNCIRVTARYSIGLAYYCKYIEIGYPPAADFKYNIINSDQNSLTIQFTDTSHGATSRLWTFPDGLPSSDKSSVTKTFTSSGVKTVELYVENQYGSDYKTMDIPVGRGPPTASFTVTPTTALTFQFQDTSGYSVEDCRPTAWDWDFDSDGLVDSNEQNPVYTYPEPGGIATKVTFIAKNKYGSSESQRPINVVAPVIAAFITQTYQNIVRFTDTTIPTPSSYFWTFGDGSNSTDQNPTHAYATAGTFNIRLAVTDPVYNHESVKESQVTISFPPPVANFSPIPDKGMAPLAVQFSDTSIYYPTNRLWNFGDGNNTWSTSETTFTHVFENAGTYTVTLTVNNPGGSDNATATIEVTPGIKALPGNTYSPTDPDGDGLYEDLNGNGRMDFSDAVLYFNQMTWITENEPIAAFDFNNNDRIDFADMVALFNEI